MEAVAIYPHSVFSVPSCSSLFKHFKPISTLKDGSLAFDLRRKGVIRLRASNTNSDESRRGKFSRKVSSPGKSRKDPESKKLLSSDVEVPVSTNKEEVLGLFSRIRSSISKRKTTGTQKKNPNTEPPTERDLMLQCDEHRESESKPKRPPSGFVRKSPVSSSPSILMRKEATEVNNETSAASAKSEELRRMEGMKLLQLKALAKRKGMKGYSKLKKSELLELLLRS